MKMKIRPLTVLLLIILLVVGINAALFHMGKFDSFLAGKADEARQREGEGPVVRREVSNLVLPLESSRTAGDPQEEDVLNETDISIANKSVAKGSDEGKSAVPKAVAEVPVVENQKKSEAPVKKPAVAKAPVVAEQKKPAVAKAPIVEQQKKPEAPAKKTVVAGKGDVGKLAISCAGDAVSIEIPLSAEAGKIRSFELKGPRRLVVDIYGKWKNKGQALYRNKGCPVEKIVLGEHADKIRMVLHIGKKDAPAKISPDLKKKADGVSLKFTL